jgi:hypothetical protein
MADQKSEAKISGSHSVAPGWTDVAALGHSTFRIRLGGQFGAAWLARFCRGLASQRISIQRAHAMRAPNRSWNAELHVLCLPGAPALSSVPLLQLTAAELPEPTPLELTRYALTASTAHGGTLHLKVEAADTLGLLGSLLAQLATLQLHPIEMHIETRDGRAEDSLWLYTDHATRPTFEFQEALERTLEAALRSNVD